MLVVDVLHFVARRVIIRLLTRCEESDWNPEAGVVVMIASAVNALGMPVGIKLIIELERPRALTAG